MLKRAAPVLLLAGGHHQANARAVIHEAADADEARFGGEDVLPQIHQGVGEVLPAVPVPAQKGARVLPNGSNHHQLAHLLREMRWSV